MSSQSKRLNLQQILEKFKLNSILKNWNIEKGNLKIGRFFGDMGQTYRLASSQNWGQGKRFLLHNPYLMSVVAIPTALFHPNLPGRKTILPAWRRSSCKNPHVPRPLPYCGSHIAIRLEFLQGSLLGSVEHFIHVDPWPSPGWQHVCRTETRNCHISAVLQDEERHKVPLLGWALKSVHCLKTCKNESGHFLLI